MNAIEKIDNLIEKINFAASAKIKRRYLMAVQIVFAYIIRDLEEIRDELKK